MAMLRSAASVLVGSPVEGPPRCTSMISSGSSSDTARLVVSLFRATPGPLVEVTPRCPANAAPSAMPTAAISSSACTVRTPKCLCFDSSWRMSLAGVIGIAAEEDRQLGQLPGRHQTPRQRNVAADVGVLTGRQLRRQHLEAMLELLGGLTEVEAGGERCGVAEADEVVLEPAGDPVERRLRRAANTATRRGRGRRSSWTARHRAA